ncbi:conserved hypothetical protein [Bradyrhizobium sp. ORS 375]|uniref:hypothetical protein n=1 Tax=Bradyrhizobium sp. (strain ORS 375) TaxID=566679 RepID=UPI00024069C7|nr:hypothetical protein [Bradyrhizobium sp. ORS 375]CCD94867.1 conserved hypothetical protein [Bradyrhizobium sp. ORS 375]
MTEQQRQGQQSLFDKEPAEGSRETIDKQLKQQEQKSSHGTADPVTAPKERES